MHSAGFLRQRFAWQSCQGLTRQVARRMPTQLNSPRSVRLWRSQQRYTSTGPRHELPGKESVQAAKTPWHTQLDALSKFLSWIHRAQLQRPRTVQVCASLITYGLGDLLAQGTGSEAYDPWRTVRMLIIGGLVAVPGYKWFMWLGGHFNYPSKVLSIATKVVVQQVFFTPVINTYFFGMQAALTGVSFDAVLERIRATVPQSIVNSLKFWPAVTVITFTFIAPTYRFMFSGLFAVMWQGYLSFLNRWEEKQQQQTEIKV